jgi:Ca2+-transporting ATPase
MHEFFLTIFYVSKGANVNVKYYLEDSKAILDRLETTQEGLSSGEADRRLEIHGPNALKQAPKPSLLRRFFQQMADPMIIILLAAAAISGVTAFYAKESFADVFIILFVVIVNTVLGLYQENKAEAAIEALQKMSAATSKVLRDGEITQVPSNQLVPGDIVVLEAGDAVPADARILEAVSLKLEEAALTGESVPVNKATETLTLAQGQKDVSLGDRKNMVYMGSTVVYGRGRAVIVETGMGTEMGKIADAITQAKEEKTPLQRKLSQLSKVLTYLVVGVCLFIFVFGLFRSGSFTLPVVIDTFMVAVSLAVAAIPEGLAAVVTIVLSIGVTNMSRRKAVIRRLTAVETLGSTEVICSDKTGTLTQNKMTVVDDATADKALLATAMALCSDARLDQSGQAVGEPTECALVNYAYNMGINKTQLAESFPRSGEAPFDSLRKMMSTVHPEENGYVQYTKGAPDEVLKRCTHILTGDGVVPMTPQLAQAVLEENKAMAARALRVLSAAMRYWDHLPEDNEPATLEQELIFIGLVGMIDPVRPEVKAAIAQCRQAGIRPIMITGDHRDTAVAIGMELGIITDPSQAITGAELDALSDETLKKSIRNYSVYARVQPEHKVRIVNAWKKLGKITAMTGDGVNDAPSIKSADIGVGMGITGTDVTKNVADMVLADDNFATIVAAVEEGRRIYDNIRKSIQFLLASNLSEVLSIFAATVMGFTILHPVHILWINLITDSFPALALGMEKGENDLMRRPPRPSNEGIFAGGLGFGVAYQGVMIALVTLAAYFIGHFMEAGRWEIAQSADGITMAFLTLSMAEIFHSFNMRSQEKSIFRMGTHNLYLYGAMLLSLVLTTTIIYVPFLAQLFEFEHISLTEYGVAMLLAFSVIPLVELVKFFVRRFGHPRAK